MSFSALIYKFKNASSSKDAVNIYKGLCDWLEKNSPHKENKLEYFIVILNKHMVSQSSSVRISSMKACGYLLKHISIKLTNKQEDEIIDNICKNALNMKSKSTQYHACWCLAIQRLPPTALSRNFDKIFSALLSVLNHTIDGDECEIIELEAIGALGKLCENCPSEMKENILSNENGNGWVYHIVIRFVGKGNARNINARKLFQQGYTLINSLDMETKILLGKEVKCILNQGILTKLEQYINESSPNEASQVNLLKSWGYIIILLQEKILFKDAKFLNRLLAIVNKAFLHPSNEIQLQAYDSWKYFICVITSNIPKLIRHKQRLMISLSPSLRALTKNTNEDIRISAYHVYAQIIYSLGNYKIKDSESLLCLLFDEILLPLKEKVIENPLNEEHSPSLVYFVIELFANLLYVNISSSSSIERIPIDVYLVQDELEDIPLLVNYTDISSEFINQRLSFFLEILAYCLNHKNINVYQQDCKANLISIWENLITHIFNSIEEPERKSSALYSIKKLIIFPFSYPSTSQVLCDNWTVVIREELLSSFLSHVHPKIIVSNQYKLSWRAESCKLPISVFLCCCWIQSIREGLCGKEKQIEKDITCSMISKCQLSVFRSILKMIQQYSDSALDHFDAILRQMIPGEKELLSLEELIPLWCTFSRVLTDYIKESNNTGVTNKYPQGHPVIYHTLEIPLNSNFTLITENQIKDNDILSHWEELYVSFRSSILIHSLKGEWKTQLIHCLPDISVSSPSQLSIWTKLGNKLIETIIISSCKKKQEIVQSLSLFLPIIGTLLSTIHQAISFKEISNISPSGSYLILQGIKVFEMIIKLLKYLSSLHKQKLFLLTIQMLKESLLTWLKNPKPRSGDITAGECDKFRNIIEKLWKQISNTIKECKDTYNEQELLCGIEFMLTYAFKSKFRWLKSSAILCWNSNFSEYESSYPPNFYKLLSSLKSKCDIIVPKISPKLGQESSIKDEEDNEDLDNIMEDIGLDSLPDIPEIDQVTSFSPESNYKEDEIKTESKQEVKNEFEKPTIPNENQYKSVLHKRKNRPPLTEKQKEKRREQQQNSNLWDSKPIQTNPLTTQEISDELWGTPDITNEMPNKKRKLTDSSMNIYTQPKIELNNLSTVDYIDLLHHIGNDSILPGQLSVSQLIQAQNSVNRLMKTLIDKLEDSQME